METFRQFPLDEAASTSNVQFLIENNWWIKFLTSISETFSQYNLFLVSKTNKMDEDENI